MSDRNIDNAYKKAFPKQEYVYNPEYWAQMESAMGPASPRVPSWWWKAASGVLAVATAASVWFWNAGVENSVVADAASPSVETTVNPESNNSSNEALSIVQDDISTTTSPDQTAEVAAMDNSLEESNTATNTTNQEVNGPSNGVNIPSNRKQASPGTAPSKRFNKQSAKASIQQAGLSLSSKSSGLKSQASFAIPNEEVQQKTSSNPGVINSANTLAETNSTIEQTTKASTIIPRMTSQNADGLFPLPSAEQPDFSSSSANLAAIKRNPFKMPKFHFYFGASAGYSMLHNDEQLAFKPTGNYQNLSMDMYRNQSIEAGIDFGVKFRNFLIQSGVKYSSLSQAYEMNFTALTEKTEITVSSNRVIEELTISPNSKPIVEYDQDGTLKSRLDIVYDTSWAVQTDTSYLHSIESSEQMYRSSYSINYAQIPLYIGYELPLKDFYLHLSTGMDMALLVNASGTVYDAETQSIVQQLDKSELNSVLWKYRLNLGIGYNVNERVSLYFNPTFARSFNTAYKAGHSYSGQFSSYGINAGLRYQF